jgi:hypothetical protein
MWVDLTQSGAIKYDINVQQQQQHPTLPFYKETAKSGFALISKSRYSHLTITRLWQ